MSEIEFQIALEGNQIGYALVSEAEEGGYRADTYQNRFNTHQLNDVDELAESKLYIHDTLTELEAMNSVLDFWGMPQMERVPTVFTFDTHHSAMDYMKVSNMEYIYYRLKEDTDA